MYKPVLKLLWSSLMVAGLAGCAAVGPDYRRPALDVPDTVAVAKASVAGATRANAQAGNEHLALLAWWKSFQDPALDSLLIEADTNSQDLLLAAARIDEARSTLAVTQSSRAPSVDATAGGTRSRSSQNTNLLPPGANNYGADFRLGLSASYEIDFWGKFSRADEAARARLMSQQAARGTVLSSLYATLAVNYFALRSYDAQLALADAALQTRQENLRLQQKRFSAGSVGTLEMHQAESEVAATEVTRAQVQQRVAVTESALALLAGRSPRAIATPVIARGLTIDALYARLQPPVDLPADLLNRRPDILAAEQLLVAANADIGQARAAYFPSIRLTSGAGYQSDVLRTLINPASLLWNLGANLVQPVFRGGALGAVVSGAEARKAQAQAQYILSVQNGFRDVHDALTALNANELVQSASLRRAAALKDTLRLATLRYNNGYSSYLEVLTAQRDLLQTQSSVIDVQRTHLSAAVDLFKAVGGGWDSASMTAAR